MNEQGSENAKYEVVEELMYSVQHPVELGLRSGLDAYL
jgi:hypothetical protein